MAKATREKLRLAYLNIDDIDVSLSNVRKSNVKEGIDELAKSIREIGVQQPVMVVKKGQRYELVIGQRRYLACKQLGEKTIPALITKVESDTDAAIRSFSENIQRRVLDYRDKMQAALTLRKELKSIDAVARRLGVTPQTVRNYLGYAGVREEIKAMVTEKRFSASTALRITRGIEDEELALKIAEEIKDMPRSEQKNLVIDAAIQNPNEKRPKKLVKIAEKAGHMRKITIHVTQRVYKAISRASREYQSDREMLVKEAIEEWLTNRGFIK